MRIGRRYTAALAVAAIGTVGVGAIALAAPNGNSSTVSGRFSPSKLPKKRFKAGSLFVHTHTTYADPGNKPAGGFTHRAQIFFDDDGKITTRGIPRCNSSGFAANTTMRLAMEACGTAKVGRGRAETAGISSFPACVLAFNGTRRDTRPTTVLFTRVDFTPPADCSDPSHNTGGDTSITLIGVLKKASGDFGTQLDVNNIDNAALPLGDFKTTVRRGRYVSSRCHDRSRRLNIKAKFTYSDGQSDIDRSSQRCRIRR